MPARPTAASSLLLATAHAMPPRASRSTLVLLTTALAATALLGLGLARLRFSPGLPLPAVDGDGVLVGAPEAAGLGQVAAGKGLLWILVLGLVLLFLHALWRALRGVRLRALVHVALRGILAVVGVCLAVGALTLVRPSGFVAEAPPLPPPAPAPRAPLGEPPSLLLWLTAAAVALASLAIAAWLLRPRPPVRDPLFLVGLEAERARTELLSGADARSVILACYARMSAILAEERSIERPRDMTAREFGDVFGSLGVPSGPVLELTRTFEAARYGATLPGPDDGARALACLGPIVEHCHAAAGSAS
jgi:hypothetical protein